MRVCARAFVCIVITVYSGGWESGTRRLLRCNFLFPTSSPPLIGTRPMPITIELRLEKCTRCPATRCSRTINWTVSVVDWAVNRVRTIVSSPRPRESTTRSVSSLYGYHCVKAMNTEYVLRKFIIIVHGVFPTARRYHYERIAHSGSVEKYYRTFLYSSSVHTLVISRRGKPRETNMSWDGNVVRIKPTRGSVEKHYIPLYICIYIFIYPPSG